MDTVDFTKFCLLTGSRDNLGTKMDIEHEGKSYKIAICDEAAEEASLRVIKSRLVVVLAEMEALISRARDFGLVVTYSSQPKPPRELVEAAQLGIALAQVGAPSRSAGHTQVVAGDDEPRVVVENVELKDLDGNRQAVEIPKKIVDKNGTTDIQIVKVSNRELLEKGSNYNNTDFRKGYASNAQTQTCAPCRGQGVVRMKSSQAKHCNGCAGSGNVTSKTGTTQCTKCAGAGSIYFTEINCKKCGGLGLLNT